MVHEKSNPSYKAWEEFLDKIRDARSLLNNPQEVWYRGQSDISHRLVPSLLRSEKGPLVEKEIYLEYEKFSLRIHGKRDDDWLTLMDMQHYGIPTRLLDWTTVLGVAITFAVLDGRDNEDSAIYILDPIALNSKSGVAGIRRIPDKEGRYQYQNMYWYGNPLKPLLPISIDAKFHNDRISAQNGTFTVHGTELYPFEEKSDDTTGENVSKGSRYVEKVILPATAKQGAREFLEYANLNAYSIYPDAIGMAIHLKHKFLK